MRFFPAALLLGMPLLAAESYEVFLPPHADRAALHAQLSLLLPEGATCRYTELSPSCPTMAEARRHARAIAAGVTQLPSLALADEKGFFAILPLQGLQKDAIEAARHSIPPSGREEAARQRLFTARLYLLCARLSLEEMDDAGLAASINVCRELLQEEQANAEQRQFLGLRCLYPLLMMQYSRGYTGAHTPETEEALLEAIAALEAARDIDPLSFLGRQAHEEREKLRAARIKSRQYE